AGYLTFEAYLANEAKLAANRTNAGARPPREGTALCQGIVFCGACGRSMQVRYQDRYPRYECSHSRADHVATPLCGSVRADTVDQAVALALLAAVEPGQLALALAAAGEVTARRHRSDRAAELAAERPLRRRPGRTRLPGRRAGEPPGRPQPGSPLGNQAHRPRRSPGRARHPAIRPARPARP